jgi:hypothetical protein
VLLDTNISHRKRTSPSNHFRMRTLPLSRTHCLPLKHFTKHGPRVLRVQNSCHSSVASSERLRKSRNITTKRQRHMHIPFRCVCLFFLCTSNLIKLTIHIYLVLDPEMKMAHFKRHWTADLQDKIRESAEEIVSCQMLLLFHAHIHVVQGTLSSAVRYCRSY